MGIMGIMGVIAFGVAPAFAADEFAAFFRLRGGYDSNPVLAPGGRGSAVAITDAAFAVARKTDGWLAGMVGEASVSRYADPAIAPPANARLTLRLQNLDPQQVSIIGAAVFAHAQNYDTRSTEALFRLRLQRVAETLRPFVAGELRFGALNEVNPLLGDFLPEAQRSLRGTITPGAAFVSGPFEAGVSVALSVVRYEDRFDLFGFRRDNERVQPFLFARYETETLEISASVSFLRGRMHDADFTDFALPLYEVSVRYEAAPFMLEANASRTAEETTFPVSPISIHTAIGARLSWQANERTSVGLFARALERNYWDTPLVSRVRVAGADVAHRLASDYTIGAELAYAHSVLLSGAEAEGWIATLGVARRFGGRPEMLRAGKLPAR